jgi:uncharacterized protein (DUF849 family)
VTVTNQRVRLQSYVAAPTLILAGISKPHHTICIATCLTTQALDSPVYSFWPMLAYAVTQGYATRIGLADTLLLPSGAQAHDNADLIRTALSYVTSQAN